MRSQHIEIRDSEDTGSPGPAPGPAPEGKWIISGGIEIPCEYRLHRPKSANKRRSSSCA